MSMFTMGITLLGFLCLLSIAQARKVFVSAPNTLRLDAEETVVIVTDNSNQEVDPFNVYLQDSNRKSKFSQQTVEVHWGLPKIANVKATHKDLPDINFSDLKENVYVYLVVTGNGFSKEIKLRVSPRSGHMFIQTDKPIYTPQQSVNIRVIPVNEQLLPKDGHIRLQIRNPQEIIVEEKYFRKPWDTPKGIYFPIHNYKFPPHPMLGEWSVVAQYGHEFQTNSTVHFEVDEYVLPTFTVKIDVPNVVLPEDSEITVQAVASYVYGKKVKGTAVFKFGVKHKLGNIIELGRSKPKELKEGEAILSFKTEEITNHDKIDVFPLESKLFVEVEVVDAATAIREKVINEECSFASSPYIISFKHSQRDFKPGLVSFIMAEVTYVNGKPAEGVPTSISVVNPDGRLVKVTNPAATSDKDGHVLYNVETHKGSTQLIVKIKTNDENYKESQQFTGTHILSEYKSPGGFVAISRVRGTRLFQVDDLFSATVYVLPDTAVNDIFYMILSRGRIVHAGSLSKGQLFQRELQFRITAEMAPSIRIVVYGLFNDELVADSIRVEVEHKCQPKAEVKIETKFKDTAPGSEGSFRLRGEAGTSVGILAVDSAVYALRNKDRLTKDKLFQALENDDLGCGPGGGINSESVLANAGVTIFGNFRYNSKENNDCAELLRRKREVIDATVNEHGIDAKKCCRLATIPDKYGRTCEERANIVRNFTNESDYGNCTDAFLRCCINMGFKVENTSDMRGRVVGIDDDNLLEHVQDLDDEEKQASVRKDFRETWLFQDEQIKSDGTVDVDTSLPHSITTWIIQAVSISQNWGMCVSEPQELVSFKSIFLHLNIPYSVVQNEQVEIQATVFNYKSQKVPVTVYIYGVEDLCTGVPAGEKSERKKITVEPQSAVTVGFPVIPLKVKEYTLRVVALSQVGHDVIEKTLRVVAKGVVFEETIPLLLDPSNQRYRKERNVVTESYSDTIDTSQKLQLTAVKLRPSKDYIPGTESCIIEAIGDEFGPTIETVLHNPETLVKLPIGCGEQTMMFMGPTVYTLQYLKIKGKVTPEFEGKIYGFVREGYNRELTFRKNDGSYSAFQSRPSSVWLTAFVMKVFCQSSKFIFIDPNVICTGIKWLTLQQNADGSFADKNPPVHKDMMGGNDGTVPMTAFVLISLQHCSCETEALNNAKLHALHYLQGALPNINDPYTLSLVSYALALSNSQLKWVANEKLRSMALFNEDLNQRHWSKGSKSHVIETTAYALLTQVALEEMPYSLPIINWLNTQRLAGGVFPSTQDTVIALQALSEYAIKSQSPEVDLNCTISHSNDKKLSKTLHFQNDNAEVLQQFELEKIGGTVFLRTSGKGVGLLSVKLRYNVPHPAEKLCKFDITVNVSETKVKVKPAPVNENIGKDFFDEIPVGLVRALDIEDDHIEFRRDGAVQFADIADIDPRIKNQEFRRDGAVKFADVADINPRIKNQEFRRDGAVKFAGAADINPWIINQDNDNDVDGDDRDRDIDDYDDRDRVGDKNEDERGRVNEEKVQKANSKAMLQVTICARYLFNKSTDMSIIDAGIFSGFKPEIEDLNNLLNDADGIVDRYELAGKSIIFYLKYVPFAKPVCLKFRITREFIVGALQPTVIRVYDYYNTDEACTVFYSPDSNSPLLKKICEGSICHCGEGGCPLKEPFSAISNQLHMAQDQLLKIACQDHDYVWKGTVESIQKRDGFVRINFKIVEVLKPGAEQKNQIEGVTRNLLLQDTCTSFEFINNQEYLIMGKDGERFEDRETNEIVHRYLIDKNTIIHKWMLIRKSPNKELQKALFRVATQLKSGGCTE